ncbi:hypothetical protein INP83_01805 [Mucilaginibacter sp. 21P]|uniref:hypothetical protein n=1 Tax=Mucilaginibacter sp. 21P TaxID=2778902 RepID=UPI001C59D03B|nr:hypothetical protein [Mucilaginibacter sp. 21P]QXV65858.1 hypothetical protein INP83_01805 [Mucilaginibacter sp. 21P]
MARISLIWFMIIFFGVDKLALKNDLKNDRRRLKDHGVYLERDAIIKLRAFDRYASLDLNGYKFSKRKINNHVISRWYNSKAKQYLYQIESISYVDTLLANKEVYIDTIKKDPQIVKPKISVREDFKFRTYIIGSSAKERLVYLTQEGEGLVWFSMGNKNYSPVREDIIVGVVYPNMTEINKLIKQM